MDYITKLLNLEDSNIFVSDVSVEGNIKFVTLETHPTIHHCPLCGFRMHSRGIKTRTINHPILQQSFQLIIKLKQRRWRCTNELCLYEVNESFKFVNKHRRNTNTTDLLIIDAFHDLSASVVSIAERFHVSDTYALDVFDHYVKMPRLPLTDIISIDEVCLDFDSDSKYALVIQDFRTGEPIDLLCSRRSNVTESYFSSIPKEERFSVKYLISDMYNPYINYVDKYFPNALPVVDSFHVIQWIVRELDNYIKQLIRKFKQQDRQSFFTRHPEAPPNSRVPLSDEVYLLQKYRWLILANQSNITYYTELRMDKHFRCLMNTYDYEDALFRIDPKLRRLRDLKELYIVFNKQNAGNPLNATIELDKLIEYYLQCGEPIFRKFANLLIQFHDYIINSFIMVEKCSKGDSYFSRLSNGPIESMNRKIKDLKRLGRGYRNFEHFRNRFLYACRENPSLHIPSIIDYDFCLDNNDI